MNDNLAPIIEAITGQTDIPKDLNQQASIVYEALTGREAEFSFSSGNGGFKVHKYNPLVELMLSQFGSMLEPGSGKDVAIKNYHATCFPNTPGQFALLTATKDQEFLATLAASVDDVTATVPVITGSESLKTIVPYVELSDLTSICASMEEGSYCITHSSGVDALSPLRRIAWEELCSQQLFLSYTNPFGQELHVAQLLYKDQCVYFIPLLTGDVLGEPYDPNTFYLWASTINDTSGMSAFNYYLVRDGSPVISTLYGLWHVPGNWTASSGVVIELINPDANDVTPGVVPLHEQLLTSDAFEGAPTVYTAVAPVPRLQVIFIDGQSVDDPGFLDYGPSVSLEL